MRLPSRPLVAALGAALLLAGCGSSSGSGNPPPATRAPAPSGSVGAVASPSVTQPPPAADIVAPTLFGMHMLKVATKGLPPIRLGSIRLWDTGTTWAALEPERGSFDWTRLDDAVMAAQDGDVPVLLVLGQTPQWASTAPERKDAYGMGAAAPPADTTDWTDYVTAVATRYQGRIAGYEMWNEPNLDGVPAFFTGTSQKMAELSRAAATAIRAVDPTAELVSPGLSARTPGALEFLNGYLAAGGADGLTAIGTHIYPRIGQSPEEAYTGLIGETKGALEGAGVDLPIWNTEIGYGRTYPGEPAKNVLYKGPEARGLVFRTALMTLAAGLTRSYWYAYDNRGFVGLYLVSRSGKPTPAAAAFEESYRWLAGARFAGCSNDGPRWTCSFGYATGSAQVLWTIGKTISVPADGSGVQCVRHTDGSVEPVAVGAAVELTQNPVMIVSSTGGDPGITPLAGTLADGDLCRP